MIVSVTNQLNANRMDDGAPIIPQVLGKVGGNSVMVSPQHFTVIWSGRLESKCCYFDRT